jgi:dihydroorotase
MPASVIVDEAAFQETPMSDAGEGYALRALLRRLPPELHMRIQVTQPQHVDLILAERERLPNILVQVPHHALSIDHDLAHQRIGAAARHHPPLRSADEVAQMQAYAREGKIDVMVAFHAPHRMQDKFSADPIPGELTLKAGFTAIDFAYPHFLTRLGIETTCRAYCETPARVLGLKKGRIAKGYDADFVVLAEDEGLAEQNLALQGGFTRGVWKVEPMEFFSMGKVTPFTGERLSYRVLRTFLRGEAVFDRETGTHRRAAVRRVEAFTPA